MAKSKLPGHFFCHTWCQNFYFYLGWPPEELKKRLKGYDGNFEVRAKTIVDSYGHIHIWTKKKKCALDDLAHECVHAANMTLGRAGVEPCFGNDESQAYLVGSIMRFACKSR